MRKEYELWLDESGQFVKENELKAKNRKPSLVGGFLVEKEVAEQIPYEELIDSSRNHAMNLTSEDKQNYVLPVLEQMQAKYRARQVFFENAEYADEATGRQLYLRILAEGLLQLLQLLNAQSESVELSVIIAQRQDMAAEVGKRKILSAEYVNMLRQLMEKKRREHRILLHENSSLEFQIKAAHLEHKLQLADFACNTRLTRDSFAFQNVRERVSRVQQDAYLFTLSEITSANYIRRSLADGYISDAIMELYTTKDTLDYEKQLDLILQRMRNTNYRLVKSQMKQCVADITAFAAKEDDYEIGEQFLKRIVQELVPELKKEEQPYQELQFAVLIQLADMYLREGDILAADKVMKTCRKVQEEMGNSLEYIFTYYQLLEKEALLAIDEFDFEQGKELMQQASGIFIRLMEFMQADGALQQRFPTLKSEYFGDALCMQIYAMLFLQRRQPELYGELCRLSDLALMQYPDTEGELERHRQYRSHIELEQGNFESALRWLFQAKCYYEEEVSERTMVNFLNLVCDTEAEVSCKYYLMYYLLILCECKIKKHPQAEQMYRALQKQERLLKVAEIRSQEEEEGMQEVDISVAQADSTNVQYHPQEVLFWKYATYLNLNEYEPFSLKYYERAARICFAKKEYLTMYLTGLGIEAERISCLFKMKRRSQAMEGYHGLVKRIDELKKQTLPEGTRRFLQEFQAELAPNQEAMWKASRQVAY